MAEPSGENGAALLPPDSVYSSIPEGDPAGYLASRSHEAALEGLCAALREDNELLVLTGEPGAGKTMVLRKLALEMAGTVRPVFCPAGGLDLDQILNFVCAELRLAVDTPTRSSKLEALTAHLASAAAKPIALLIDDADRLHGDALEQLLRLSRAVERRRGLHLVLSGRPALQERLRRARASHPGIVRAVFARLTRLSSVEAAALVERLAATRGAADGVRFERAAIQRIAELGAGVPGTLVALYTAAVARARRSAEITVSAALVAGGAEDLLAQPSPSQHSPGATLGDSEHRALPGDGDGRPEPRARQRGRLGLRSWRAAGVAATLLAAATLAVGAVYVRHTQERDLASQVSTLAIATPAPAPAAAGTADDERGLAGVAAPAGAARDAEGDRDGTAAAAGSDAGPFTAVQPAAAVAASVTAAQDPPTRLAAAAPAPVESAPPEPGRPAVSPAGRALEAVDGPSGRTPGRSPQAARTHLQRAWAAFDRKALTTPANDNAVKWAESALAAAPGDAAPIEVLQAVIDTYLRWADANLRRNDLADAARYLERARSVARHASPEQRAAIEVLDGEIGARQRRVAKAPTAPSSRRRHHMEAPQWFQDLDAFVQRASSRVERWLNRD